MIAIRRNDFAFSFLLLIAWAVLTIDAVNVHAGSCGDSDVANLYPIAKDLPYVVQAHVKQAAAMDSLAKHNLMRTKELQTQGDIIVTSANGPIAFRAPRVVLKPGFNVERGSSFVAGLRTFDVHFINMADQGTSADFVTEEWCRNEVDILNHKMANQDGELLVRFRYKSHESWNSDFSNSGFYKCISSGWGGNSPPYALCDDPNLTSCSNIPGCFNGFSARDDNAINVIVYKNPHAGYSSFANRNPGNAPFVVLNYILVDDNLTASCNVSRFDNISCPCTSNGTCPTPSVAPCDCNENGVFDDDPRRGDSNILGKIVEIHEMGHVFGVHHMQPIVATPQHSISNVMWGGLAYDDNSKCFSGSAGRTHAWDATELFFFDPAESFIESDPTDGKGNPTLDTGEIDYCQRFIHNEACYWDDVNTDMVADHDLLPDTANHFGQAEIIMSYAEFIAKNIGMRTW